MHSTTNGAMKYDITNMAYILFHGPFFTALYGINTSYKYNLCTVPQTGYETWHCQFNKNWKHNIQIMIALCNISRKHYHACPAYSSHNRHTIYKHLFYTEKFNYEHRQIECVQIIVQPPHPTPTQNMSTIQS